MLSLCDGAKETLKGVVEKEAKKETQEQTEGESDLLPQEHEKILKGV